MFHPAVYILIQIITVIDSGHEKLQIINLFAAHDKVEILP